MGKRIEKLESSFPHSTDLVLEELLKRYAKHGRTIPVKFRKLVPWLNGPDRFTHLLHPYPAKLLVHIPHFFLSSSLICQDGGVVLDPFCGSGTVLLESVLSGRRAIGVDSNPLARLIAEVKTTPYKSEELLNEFYKLKRGIPAEPTIETPKVVNIEYWFYKHVLKKLLCTKQAILEIKDRQIRNFFLVCFSKTVKEVSLADPKLSVPVKLRRDKYSSAHPLHVPTTARLNWLRRVNVISVFENNVMTNVKRFETLTSLEYGFPTAQITTFVKTDKYNHSCNAFSLAGVGDNSIDLVITSPPYAGAQKYIRSSSLSLGWLDLAATDELRLLESYSIGREHFRKHEILDSFNSGISELDSILMKLSNSNSLRAHILYQYFRDMDKVMKELYRVLKTGNHLVLIIGNNNVCGKPFNTSLYLQKLANQNGLFTSLKLSDGIISRSLLTKRNGTKGVIEREVILVLTKE